MANSNNNYRLVIIIMIIIILILLGIVLSNPEIIGMSRADLDFIP